MSRSPKRQREKLLDRRLSKMKHHLEVLGAAFARETDLLPSQTCLRTDTATDEQGRPAGLKYWYEKFEPKKLEDGDVQELIMSMEIIRELVRLHDEKLDLSEVMDDARAHLSRFIHDKGN